MKSPSSFLPVILPCAIVACLSLSVVTGQNTPAKKPTTWEDKKAALLKKGPTDLQRAEIAEKLPPFTAKATTPYRILVFYRCEGFVHLSITFANEAFRALGEREKNVSVDFSDDYASLTKESLTKYDAIVFNNTTALKPNEENRAAILGFIRSGKGILGIHAAADNFKEWPEGVALMGGNFDGHPWTANGTWAFKLEDVQHPLNRTFKEKGFLHNDEIYQYKQDSFAGRDKLRILVSLDMDHPLNHEPLKNERWQKYYAGVDHKKIDVPVSWCRKEGDGKLFYTNFGHRNETFSNPQVMRQILDGLQFVMGDIEADSAPSSEVKVEMATAPQT